MKKTFFTLLALLTTGLACYAQQNVQDSWLVFPSGNGPTFIRENWGLNISGSHVQPVKVISTSFLVGYTSNGEDLGEGHALISGNVGIGTKSPQARLEVGAPTVGVGPSGLFHLTGGQSWGHVLTLTTDNTNGNDDARLLFNYRNRAKQWAVGGQANTDRFSIWEDAGDGNNGTVGSFGNERFTVQAGGNVGIGTSDTHGYKLAVNGNIHTQEVKVDMTGWPDYVFKPAYHLPSLTEVSAFITKNGHLPEIPSEQQVAKDGIGLGEMNKLLTKKIEELTLYLIEKDKEAKAQTEKNHDLEGRLTRLEALLTKPVTKE